MMVVHKIRTPCEPPKLAIRSPPVGAECALNCALTAFSWSSQTSTHVGSLKDTLSHTTFLFAHHLYHFALRFGETALLFPSTARPLSWPESILSRFIAQHRAAALSKSPKRRTKGMASVKNASTVREVVAKRFRNACPTTTTLQPPFKYYLNIWKTRADVVRHPTQEGLQYQTMHKWFVFVCIRTLSSVDVRLQNVLKRTTRLFI